MWLKLAIGVGALVLPAMACADDSPNGLFACVAKRPDASRVWVDSLRFGSTADYAWASGKVHVLLKNNSQLEYIVRGKAQPMMGQLPRNEIEASFAYADFACVVQNQSIKSVHNCKRFGQRRTCQVGIEILGTESVYSVSLVAERLSPGTSGRPLN
jgi:hypothetical protein